MEMQREEMEIDLIELFFYLKKRIIMILAVCVACVVLGFVGTKLFISPEYTANTRMYVLNRTNETGVVSADFTISNNILNDYKVLITGQNVTKEVIKQLELDIKPEELSEADAQAVVEAKGISFDLSVPEDALMTVGTDLEVSEGESEIFFYDSGKFYYVVEDGKIYKVFGYLEFEPGFNGTVIVPFESFSLDAEVSKFYDGLLNYYDIIDYFGFSFNTDYYASIEDTTVSIDNITFYQDDYEYIDYIWANQTGNTPLALQETK